MSERIKLNVGGTRYETTKITLMRDAEGMLARLIQQPNEMQSIKEGGELFIDRDGTYFGHVLNYLRSGDQAILPLGDEHIRRSLMQEADFYQLPGLLEFVKRGVAFKIGDMVQLHSLAGYTYFDSLMFEYSSLVRSGFSARGYVESMCWICRKIIQQHVPFCGKIRPQPYHEILIGQIRQIDDQCAMVEFANGCVKWAYSEAELNETNYVRKFHLPLMYLKLK